MGRYLNPAEIYASELVRLRYGHPLWCPEPTEDDGEIKIGDVGYISGGTFHRLFNAACEEGNAINNKGVPEGFIPLEMPHVYTQPELVEAGEALCSQSTRQNKLYAKGEVPLGPLSAGAGCSFTWSGKRGAVALLGDGGEQQRVVRSAAFPKYIYDHHLSWHKLAGKRNLDLRVEDIVLVSGCVKTSSWALAAYNDRTAGNGFSISLSANGLFTFSPGYTTEKEHHAGVQHREGPKGRPLGPKDQCVFVQYYKCLPKGFGRTRIRRPENLKESDMREHVPDQCFCAPFDSVRRWFRNHFGNCCCCCGDEEPEVEEKPAQPQMSEPEDPVVSVLQYIAQKYPTTVAVAGHSDLYSLLHGVNWPESVSAYLAEKQPKILLDASGAHLLVQDTEDIQDIANVREPPSPRSVRAQESPSPWKAHAPTLGRPMKARGLKV
ncbi:hypothetical protein PHLGIDRAFT_152457 [Phlebiopsis gigantea 11061_1 CR5-6]|uniref:Uncharacterized protein n=1 Tax=Phlebiopsis gigantea (strain 11061_1 CR5-6) TaxID=745531 RepID=A0A0C3PHP9_PHLG1|nr:hypothetical protein PHLGIDRAFT_152457 [Phlebiopsis gigantea 11061_1 CR5-6]